MSIIVVTGTVEHDRLVRARACKSFKFDEALILSKNPGVIKKHLIFIQIEAAV